MCSVMSYLHFMSKDTLAMCSVCGSELDIFNITLHCIKHGSMSLPIQQYFESMLQN